jgi:hypothetical protein
MPHKNSHSGMHKQPSIRAKQEVESSTKQTKDSVDLMENKAAMRRAVERQNITMQWLMWGAKNRAENRLRKGQKFMGSAYMHVCKVR